MKKLIATVALGISLVTLVGLSQARERQGPTEAREYVEASCLAALDAADDIIDINTDVATGVSTYFGTVADAARRAQPTLSGLTTLLNDQTAATKALTATYQDATARLTAPGASYQTNSAACRAGK